MQLWWELHVQCAEALLGYAGKEEEKHHVILQRLWCVCISVSSQLVHAQFRAWAILAMSPLEVALWHIVQAFSRLSRSFSDTCTRTPVNRHTHHHTLRNTNHALHHLCTYSAVWAYMNVSLTQVRQEGTQQFTQRLDVAQHSVADKLFVWHAVLCEAETETLHPVVVVSMEGKTRSARQYRARLSPSIPLPWPIC